jgi:hypothetical protein
LIKLKKTIKRSILNLFGIPFEILSISRKELFEFLLYTFVFVKSNNSNLIVNFIVTSKAEVRVFTPILHAIIDQNEIRANILFFEKFSFEKRLNDKIENSDLVYVNNGHYAIFKSIKNKNYLNVICLDHVFCFKHHKKGIDIINFLNKNKAKTVAVQHGGNQEDNIIGQITSSSIYQIVFGKLIYTKMIEGGRIVENTFLTGNPLHDKLYNSDKINFRSDDRKVISLITCLHTEYDDRANPLECYLTYLRSIYNSIDYIKYVLYIKMHPNDLELPNIYETVREELQISNRDVIVLKSEDQKMSVYDLVSDTDLVISRSSSIIEESLMLSKKVLVYDLFQDGPSKHYDFLLKYDSYTKIIGLSVDLNKPINYLINYNVSTKDNVNELRLNTTYKFDGNSSNRIIEVFKRLAKV